MAHALLALCLCWGICKFSLFYFIAVLGHSGGGMAMLLWMAEILHILYMVVTKYIMYIELHLVW